MCRSLGSCRYYSLKNSCLKLSNLWASECPCGTQEILKVEGKLGREKEKSNYSIRSITCPSLEWTRALRQYLAAPVKFSNEPHGRSRGGFAAWAATPVCLPSLREAFVTTVFSSDVSEVGPGPVFVFPCCFYCCVVMLNMKRQSHRVQAGESGEAMSNGENVFPQQLTCGC